MNKLTHPLYAGSKTPSTDKAFNRFLAFLENLGDYELVSPYVSSVKDVLVRHNTCGRELNVKPTRFTNGNGCVECNYEKARQKSEEAALALCVERGFEMLGPYVSSGHKIKFRCKRCGKETESLLHNLRNGPGCKNCEKNRKEKAKDRLIALAEKDGYTLVSEYKTCSDKVKMRHDECGNVFEVTPTYFRYGCRCPKCTHVRKYKEPGHTDKLLRENNLTQITDYKGAKSNLKFKCNKCGRSTVKKIHAFHAIPYCLRCTRDFNHKGL